MRDRKTGIWSLVKGALDAITVARERDSRGDSRTPRTACSPAFTATADDDGRRRRRGRIRQGHDLPLLPEQEEVVALRRSTGWWIACWFGCARSRESGRPRARLQSAAGRAGDVPVRSPLHDPQSIDELLAALRPSFLARREQYFEAEAAVLAEVVADGRKSGVFVTTIRSRPRRALVVANERTASVRSACGSSAIARTSPRVSTFARLLLFA